jgi:indole-3-glycerol phosphate synthase
MLLIAEVKTVSPFGFKSDKDWSFLFDIANEHGDWISIHTDSRWGGSFDLLKHARKLTQKPILAKGIHATDDEIKRAFGSGANYVLSVGRIPPFNESQILFEPKDLGQLSLASANTKIVWNSRDLDTGGKKPETIENARHLWTGWLCQASNVKNKKDICPNVDAVLVGTNIQEFVKQRN